MFVGYLWQRRVNTVYGKESSAIYNNSTRTIQSMSYGTQYVTQVKHVSIYTQVSIYTIIKKIKNLKRK